MEKHTTKTHLTFRLSEESLNVLRLHQELNHFQDRTDALEDILLTFRQETHKHRRLRQLFRLPPDPKIRRLDQTGIFNEEGQGPPQAQV